MQLLEAFRNFDIIRKSSKTIKGNFYVYHYQVKPQTYPVKISPVKWFKLIEQLQTKFPDKGFKLQIKKVKGKLFYILRRKNSTPIYYDPKTGRIYTPKSYVFKKYKLVCHNIQTTLYNLGVKLNLRSV